MTKEDEIRKLIEKATRYLSIAEDDIQKANYDAGVSRAYYAMFYCAEALLLTKELRFSSHSGVVSTLGQYFVKTGEINPGLHRMLMDAEELRDKGDYHHMEEIAREEAERMLKNAEYFVTEIKKKLEMK